MGVFGHGEACGNPGCGHPASDHVNDRVMHDNQWRTVHRCVACEEAGGSCTDGKSILSGVVPEDQESA